MCQESMVDDSMVDDSDPIRRYEECLSLLKVNTLMDPHPPHPLHFQLPLFSGSQRPPSLVLVTWGATSSGATDRPFAWYIRMVIPRSIFLHRILESPPSPYPPTPKPPPPFPYSDHHHHHQQLFLPSSPSSSHLVVD